MNTNSLTVDEQIDAMRSTLEHVTQVGLFMNDIIGDLNKRAVTHDRSKFSVAEWPFFASATSILKNLEYDSPEYKASLDSIRPGIETHYSRNSHHPEHYAAGIDGMSLSDIVEMLCDWRAAGMRSKNGDIIESININAKRFNISDQLKQILINTVLEMNWA